MPNTRFTVLPATAVLTMLVFLCPCSKRPGHNMVPADAKMADTIHFQCAVYMLPVHISDPSTILHEVLVKKYPNLKVVEEIPNEPQGMLIHVHTQRNVQREYAPPDMESLHYFGSGITRGQAEALQNSKEAFVVEFGHAKENVWTALQTADSLIEEIARKTGGLVWDEETREIFSPDAWHEKRLASWGSGVPDISSQTTIHVYKKDDYVRAITLGIAKVGLPDVIRVRATYGLSPVKRKCSVVTCLPSREAKTAATSLIPLALKV